MEWSWFTQAVGLIHDIYLTYSDVQKKTKEKRTFFQFYLFLFPLQSKIIAVVHGKQLLTDEIHAKLQRVGIWLQVQLWAKSVPTPTTATGDIVSHRPNSFPVSFYILGVNNLLLVSLNTEYLCSHCELAQLFWLGEGGSEPFDFIMLSSYITSSEPGSEMVYKNQLEKENLTLTAFQLLWVFLLSSDSTEIEGSLS